MYKDWSTSILVIFIQIFWSIQSFLVYASANFKHSNVLAIGRYVKHCTIQSNSKNNTGKRLVWLNTAPAAPAEKTVIELMLRSKCYRYLCQINRNGRVYVHLEKWKVYTALKHGCIVHIDAGINCAGINCSGRRKSLQFCDCSGNVNSPLWTATAVGAVGAPGAAGAVLRIATSGKRRPKLAITRKQIGIKLILKNLDVLHFLVSGIKSW